MRAAVRVSRPSEPGCGSSHLQWRQMGASSVSAAASGRRVSTPQVCTEFFEVAAATSSSSSVLEGSAPAPAPYRRAASSSSVFSSSSRASSPVVISFPRFCRARTRRILPGGAFCPSHGPMRPTRVVRLGTRCAPGSVRRCAGQRRVAPRRPRPHSRLQLAGSGTGALGWATGWLAVYVPMWYICCGAVLAGAVQARFAGLLRTPCPPRL